MRVESITPKFVEFVPDELEADVLYISIKYRTATHACCCGCGSRVVTKFSPNDWRLIFDGKSVSLWPSIGNWSFDCQSHYWIRNNRIAWSRQWTKSEIDRVRRLTRHGEGFTTDPFDVSAEDDRELSISGRLRSLLRRR